MTSCHYKGTPRRLITYLMVDKTSGTQLSVRFDQLFTDQINVFKYNDVTYIGLQSRKKDYDHDAVEGNNWVEDAIKSGYY